MQLRRILAAAVVVVALAGCGGGSASTADEVSTPATDPGSDIGSGSAKGHESEGGQRFPDIVDVEITPAGDGSFNLAVTVSSPYDTPERYADGWRVLAPDGRELGTHTLLHDHAGEQPFTRTQTGVEIPADVAEVTVEGRDQRYGFGGGTVTVAVPRDDP